MITVAGTYEGKIIGSGIEPSKKIVENFAGFLDIECTTPQFAGEIVRQLYWLTDDAADNSGSKLRDLGWTGNDVNDLSELHGKDVQFAMKEDNYGKTPGLKVWWVNLARKPSVSKEQGQAIADRLRERMSRIRQSAPALGAKAPPNLRVVKQTEQFEPGGDEIPF